MTNLSSPVPRQRRLILHAGTHKTASTDIQSRLLRSRDLLAQQNLSYRFPAEEVSHFKSLSHAITHSNWSLWHDYLESMGNSDADVLISAEQFAPRLTQRKTIRKLRSLAQQHGYGLTIVIFIRSQLDYINSLCLHAEALLSHNNVRGLCGGGAGRSAALERNVHRA